MEKAKKIFHDVIVSIIIGVIFSLAFSIIFFVLGLFIKSFSLMEAVVFLRNSLSIAAPVVMLILGIALPFIPKIFSSMEDEEISRWQKIFHYFKQTGVSVIVCVVFLLVCLLVDYIVFFI